MMVTWKCELKGMALDGKALPLPGSITVGQKLIMDCAGDTANFSVADKNKVFLQLPKAQQYQLKLFETVSLSAKDARFVVTSWTAGELKPEATLTDGTNSISLGPIALTVSTVIDPKTNPEGKPYAPAGPLELGWPLWFWVLLGAVVVMALSTAGLAIFNYVQRRRFLAQLANNKPALTPFNQFSKELRKQIKAMPYQKEEWTKDSSLAFFRELESSLRWYLAREFNAPVLNGRPKAIAEEIKRADRAIFDELGRDLRQLFSEIEKAASADFGASLEDAHQLSELTRSLTERIHTRVNAKRGE
jgi:hypothetical protein